MKLTILSIGLIVMASIVHADSEGCVRNFRDLSNDYALYYTKRGVAPSIDTCLRALAIGTPIIKRGRMYTKEAGHYLYDRGIYEIHITKNNNLQCTYYGQITSNQCE